MWVVIIHQVLAKYSIIGEICSIAIFFYKPVREKSMDVLPRHIDLKIRLFPMQNMLILYSAQKWQNAICVAIFFFFFHLIYKTMFNFFNYYIINKSIINYYQTIITNYLLGVFVSIKKKVTFIFLNMKWYYFNKKVKVKLNATLCLWHMLCQILHAKWHILGKDYCAQC